MTKKIAISLHGTLSGVPFGTSLPDGKYVYQKVAPGLGNDPTDTTATQQIRRHVVPQDPQTPAQLVQRAKMLAAMNAWRALSPEAVADWRMRAKHRSTTGFHFFISQHLRGNVT
jgi:hypothetical protein